MNWIMIYQKLLLIQTVFAYYALCFATLRLKKVLKQAETTLLLDLTMNTTISVLYKENSSIYPLWVPAFTPSCSMLFIFFIFLCCVFVLFTALCVLFQLLPVSPDNPFSIALLVFCSAYLASIPHNTCTLQGKKLTYNTYAFCVCDAVNISSEPAHLSKPPCILRMYWQCFKGMTEYWWML
jgi:hypothetical protein